MKTENKALVEQLVAAWIVKDIDILPLWDSLAQNEDRQAVDLLYDRLSCLAGNQPAIYSFSEKEKQFCRMGCPLCGGKGKFWFKDQCSSREFAISGLCQECQDKFFGG